MDVSTRQVNPEFTLLNATQLATALGVTNNYITKMKASGFPMPGGRCTISDALSWRRRNPKYAEKKEK